MAWTVDRVELLKRMWTEGLSAVQIANRLGQGATRNAVIGKAKRLKLNRPNPSLTENAQLPEPRDVETQSRIAMAFREAEDGRVDLDEFRGVDELLDDPDAVDRHSEVVRLTFVLLNGLGPQLNNANNADAIVVGETRLLSAALGETPRDARPGLLMPRGDALRRRLSAEDDQDRLTDLPPMSESVKLALANLVSAYNVYVSLDPELAKRDEARLGPDALRTLVPPDEGIRVSRSALQLEAATPRAVEALAEEAKVAPSVPDPNIRASRRNSETVKNFARALLAKALAFGRSVWRVGKVAAVTVGSVSAIGYSVAKAAQWALANEAWLIQTFPNGPMGHAIRSLLEFLKALPLSGI